MLTTKWNTDYVKMMVPFWVADCIRWAEEAKNPTIKEQLYENAKNMLHTLETWGE